MKNRKLYFFCFYLITSIFISTVGNIYASTGTYSEDIPYLKGLEFNMMVNSESNRGVLLDIIMPSKTVDYFTFKFDKLDNVNYEDFNIVFDITLKSKLEDGTITTHNVSQVMDVVSNSDVGGINNLLMSVGLKDSFYEISLSFDSLVRKSPDCIATERFVADNLNFTAKKVYEYNTVISQVDCYLLQKSTYKHGLISRFNLTWDSDFRKSLCTNVSYNLIEPETDVILDSGSTTNQNGAYGYDSDGDNFEHETRSILSSIVGFFTDIPNAIVAFLTGFITLMNSFMELIQVVFPFIPAGIVVVLIVMISFILIVALYKFVQGWFG